MDEQGEPTPAQRVDLGLPEFPLSLRRSMWQSFLLEPLCMAWLFWRCGRWFAALMSLLPGFLALAVRKFYRYLGSRMLVQAVLSDHGVKLKWGNGSARRFAWSEVRAVNLYPGGWAGIKLSDQTIGLSMPQSARLIQALRDYGEPPNLVDVPGMPPRTSPVLDDLDGLRVNGPLIQPLNLQWSSSNKHTWPIIRLVIAGLLALAGWRWEAVILGAMLLPVLFGVLVLPFLVDPDAGSDWAVRAGRLYVTNARREVVVDPADIVSVRQWPPGPRELIRWKLTGETVWWQVKTVEEALHLAVRGGASQRLLEALQAAAWIDPDAELDPRELNELMAHSGPSDF